jgi:hypothetical protein
MKINIQGTIIDFPESGDPANWAPPIDQFAASVEEAFNAVLGPFDVSPQVFVMTSNANANVDLPNLAFPTSSVRAAFIEYSVFRTTNTDTGYETGTINVVYNPNNPIGTKWEITREYQGTDEMTFNITDVGQVQFTSSALSGSNHVGKITYTAKALQNS